MRFRGIVLAGGKSSRFGKDKARAEINGISLIEHSVHLIKKLPLEVVVITNNSRDYSFLDCAIERDILPERGPLGGLYTACQKFPKESLLVLTCDMPAVTGESVRVLLNQHRHIYQATLFESNGSGFEPFPGIYESCLLELIFEQIENDALSMQDFLRLLTQLHLVSHHLDQRTFFNVNRNEDLINWLNP